MACLAPKHTHASMSFLSYLQKFLELFLFFRQYPNNSTAIATKAIPPVEQPVVTPADRYECDPLSNAEENNEKKDTNSVLNHPGDTEY